MAIRQRPTGAAWAARGRDNTLHQRSASGGSNIGSPLFPRDGSFDGDAGRGILSESNTPRAFTANHRRVRSGDASLGASANGLGTSPAALGAAIGTSPSSVPFLATLPPAVHSRSVSGAISPIPPHQHDASRTGSDDMRNSPNSNNNFTASSAAGERVWKKALYEKQPFEDNYVDAAFMEHLSTNKHLRQLRVNDVVRSTYSINQQISIGVLFVVVYVAALQGMVTAEELAGLDAAMLLCGIMGYYFCTVRRLGGSSSSAHRREASDGSKQATAADPAAKKASRGGSTVAQAATLATIGEAGKRTVIIAVLLMLLSPVLHTLTRSYTDDTIWALTILLGAIHLAFADYAYLNAHTSEFRHNLSMNAAIVAVVLLASRVETPLYAAAVIGQGIMLFTLSPILRHHVRASSRDAHSMMTFLLCGVAIGCLLLLRPVGCAIFVAAVAMLTLVLPYWFVRMHTDEYKKQIHGPWDEARPRNSAAAAEWANAGLLA